MKNNGSYAEFGGSVWVWNGTFSNEGHWEGKQG